MKRHKNQIKNEGRLAPATSNAAVGNATAGNAVPVNPPLFSMYSHKKSLAGVPTPRGFLTLPEQCLSEQTRVPAILENFWARVLVLRNKDNSFSEIAYIIIIYNASVVGASLWITPQAIFVVVLIKLTNTKTPINMKNTQKSITEGLAESTDPTINQLSLELSKHDKPAALALIQERIFALKAERKLVNRKAQRLIDSQVTDLRLIESTLTPKAKKHYGCDDDYMLGHRGHMIF